MILESLDLFFFDTGIETVVIMPFEPNQTYIYAYDTLYWSLAHNLVHNQ